MLTKIKHLCQRIAPHLYDWLAYIYWTHLTWSALKARLRGIWVFRLLARFSFWLQNLKNLMAFRSLLFAFRRHRNVRPIPNERPYEIVMLALSDMRIDPRVQREAQALARAGYHVKIMVPDISTPSLADVPLDWGARIEFMLLPWQAASYVMSFPFLLGHIMLNRAVQEQPFAFHCHDLTTAVIGLTAARKVGARCVCDFHEWWSENVVWNPSIKRYIPHPPKEKRLFQHAEKFAMAHADAVITVCDSIAQELSEATTQGRRKVHVIRNIPPIEPISCEGQSSLRDQLAIPVDKTLLLWQGGTGTERNIEPIIEALAYAPNVIFVIRGPSLDMFGEGYREVAERIGAENRLILLDPVPSADVVRAAVGADIGVWSLEKLSKNFMYALPNKVFEYLAAGLPVIGANFPEVRKLVEGNGVGRCFDPDDPRAIGEVLNFLSNNPQVRIEMRQRIPALLKSLDADQEWQKIVNLYNGLAEGCEL